MNLDKVNYFNVGATETIPGYSSGGLVRVPEVVRVDLNERARFVGMDSTGVEVQFVTEAPNVDITFSVVSAYDEQGLIRIYKGNFLHESLTVKAGEIITKRLNPPEVFESVNEILLSSGGYSPGVWRIVFEKSTGIFYGVNAYGHEIRKPTKSEIPSLNWLAYGSSITQGDLNGYPHVAAAVLKAQVQNMGMGGACMIEKELVDYIFDSRSFNFLTCELGVNMRKVFSPEEFKERAAYIIERAISSGVPALFITIFPNWGTGTFATGKTEIETRNESEYNRILNGLVEDTKCKTLKLINGNEILTDTNGLSSDLIHPTEYGSAIMGINLAKEISKFCEELNIKS